MAEAKHSFAFYVENFTIALGNNPHQLTIDNPDLVHQLVHVLRAQQGQEFVLFDRTLHAQVTIEELHKKSVTFRVQAQQPNTILQPTINILLPLLKKEALEQALYSCVELGANHVQLIMTEKTQRSFTPNLERLHAIMIAAAQQSKQFSFPTLAPAISLPDALGHINGPLLAAAFDGNPLWQELAHLQQQKPAHLWLLIGPEGDLTSDEWNLIRQQRAHVCRLTPTVLRAQQALTLLLGAVRSLQF